MSRVNKALMQIFAVFANKLCHFVVIVFFLHVLQNNLNSKSQGESQV